MKRFARARRIDHRGLEVGWICFELSKVDREQGSGGELLATGGPSFLLADDDAPVEHVDGLGLGRDRQALGAFGRQHVGLRTERIERSINERHCPVLRIPQDMWSDAVTAIFGAASEHFHGAGKRFAALQALGDIGIASAAKIARFPLDRADSQGEDGRPFWGDCVEKVRRTIKGERLIRAIA